MEEEARGRCVMPRLVQCIQIWRNRVPSGQWAADPMGEQVQSEYESCRRFSKTKL